MSIRSLLLCCGLLLVSGGSVQAQSEPSLPPLAKRQELLIDAARLGRVDIIDALVKTGVDVNARDARGFTPLIIAAYNGQLAAVEHLIMAHADPCLADSARQNTALMGVVFTGHDDVALRLIQAGCDLNARNVQGQTALMMAALFDREAQAKALLAAGADTRLTDQSGNSARSIAHAQGHASIEALIDQAGSGK